MFEDKMTRAIRAYETMQTIVGAFDKKSLEKFLPQKIDNLKKLQAEMERSYTGKADWANRLRKGELTILASRPGVGIRTFALNVAASAALDDGKGVVYLNLDNCGTRRGLDVLIIDYLHLLKIRSGASKAESLKMATWALKNLAMELHKNQITFGCSTEPS